MSQGGPGIGGGADGLTMGPALVFSRRAVREVDRLAVERYGIPSIVLMENAAICLAETASEMLGDSDRAGVMIFCGPGNNGGDGLALARHLHNAGATVAVVLAAEPGEYRGDAATNLHTVQKMGLPMARMADVSGSPPTLERLVERFGRPSLVVDALLGTGVSSEVREPIARLIGWVNDLGKSAQVLSVDIPSGLDCDTGAPLGAAVRADVTVSFVGLKRGFTALTAQEYIGEVLVGDIGAPRELAERLGGRLGEQEGPDRPEDERHEPVLPTPPAAPGRADWTPPPG